MLTGPIIYTRQAFYLTWSRILSIFQASKSLHPSKKPKNNTKNQPKTKTKNNQKHT